MPSAEELRQQAENKLDPNNPLTYEVRERQQHEQLQSSNRPSDSTNAPYEPNPVNSIKLDPGRQRIMDSVLRLYSGSATHDEKSTGRQDMLVYSQRAIYDDIFSYCDTREKIAGQWYGIPVVMKSSETKAVEVVSSTPIQQGPAKDPATIVFKMKRAWTPKLSPKTFDVNHFVTLSLEKAKEEDGEGPDERVKYHKDQWNEKDYSHEGLGKVMKTLNGDYATIATRPPKDL
ncbi:hypothetical protein MBLNU230_g3698t1 [Neophaeotheca triangularis]